MKRGETMIQPDEVIIEARQVRRIVGMLQALDPKSRHWAKVGLQDRRAWGLPSWVQAYCYDNKLYLLLPGTVVVYDWFLWCAYQREHQENIIDPASVLDWLESRQAEPQTA
jgi:hypothetical protein